MAGLRAPAAVVHREHRPVCTSYGGRRVRRHPPSCGHRRPQHLAAILASLGSMCAGSVLGWPAPALLHLMNPSTTTTTNSTADGDDADLLQVLIQWSEPRRTITTDEACWVVSCAMLGGLVGTLPAGRLADWLGRRPLMLALAWPYTLGWLALVFSREQVLLLCLSRFMSGLAVGACFVVLPIYNEEISETPIRGQVGIYVNLMVAAGVLWSYALGALLPYLLLSAACMALPAAYAACVCYVPESPLHLMARGQPEEAEKALRWLRGSHSLHDPLIQREMFRIQKLVSGDSGSGLLPPAPLNAGYLQNVSLRSPTARAVVAIFGLMVFQQLTFVSALLAYLTQLFASIQGGTAAPAVSTVMVGAVQVMATATCCTLVDSFTRRSLLMTSAASVALCMGVLAIYLGSGPKAHPVGWLPQFCMALYMVGYSIGLGPIPWLVMAELAPVKHKAVISSLAVCLNWALAFFVANAFNCVVASVGTAWTYATISIFSCIGVFFVYFFVPETQGRSREEIQIQLLAS